MNGSFENIKIGDVNTIFSANPINGNFKNIEIGNVNGVFNITYPSGIVIYNNTDWSNTGCDIKRSTSDQNQHVIQLPLGANGFPEPGVYTIVYTIYDDNLETYSSVTYSYTYEYTRPLVCISQTVDCISPLFTSTDITNYTVNGVIPAIDESHTLSFPVGSGLSPLNSTGLVITAGFAQFANGTQTTEIESALTYVFPDGLIVYDIVTGIQEVVVDCTDTCSIYCCVRSIEQQMSAAMTTNVTRYEELTHLFTQIMSLVGLVSLARSCNKGADISGYLNLIKSLAHCTDDCSCGTTPSLVTGLGGLINNVVVDSAGEPITVTPVTVGSTTTYTISFSSAILTAINSLYNTEVVAGNNITVTDSGIVGIIRTYTINGLRTTVSAGSGITVTPGATVAGVTNYVVSADAPAPSLIKFTKEFYNSGDGSTETITYAELVAACGGGFINGYLGTGTSAQPKTDFHIQLWAYTKLVWNLEVSGSVAVEVVPLTGDITMTFNIGGQDAPILWRAVLIG
jgi:hypothetical protein